MIFLDKIIEIVSFVTEIPSKEIIGKSRKEETVIARKLFINVCLKYGFTTLTIAMALNRTRSGVQKLFVSSLDDQERELFKRYYRQICDKIKTCEFDK